MTDEIILPEADVAAGEAMFAKEWRFVLGAPKLDVLPPADRPEIAFAGRSNVGKSSLLNAVMNHHGLARTSNTPGRTQELNYFRTSEALLYLVDMPGYGFAEAPKANVDSWNKLLRAYLAGRPTLARVFLMIDSRHGLKAPDKEIMAMLNAAAVTYQVVLTKSDKIKPTELEALTRRTLAALKSEPAAFPYVLATSSETKEGIDILRGTIAGLLREHSPGR
jgi:GTP-binding protein